jgi:exopolysaccharide biosynthesis protein
MAMREEKGMDSISRVDAKQVSEQLPSGFSRRNTSRNAKRRKRRIAFGTALLLLFGAGAIWLYGTNSGRDLRIVLAEDCLSSQHPWLADLFVGPDERKRLLDQMYHGPVVNSEPNDAVPAMATPTIRKESELIQYTVVHEKRFTAYILKITDPSTVHLVQTKYAKKGEALSELLKDTDGIAGINAGGFDDPKGNGSGGTPIGNVVSFGNLSHTDNLWEKELMCGFLKNDQFFVGNYNAEELKKMQARDAVHFYPELIVNGHPMIQSGDGGWGYAPRTAIGATRDGQVLFVVTNGRFVDGPWNVGASLRDVQDLMLSYGCVNALNLDGGGSSTMMLDGKLLNHPQTDTAAGMRYLPNAYVVIPKPGMIMDGPGMLESPDHGL